MEGWQVQAPCWWTPSPTPSGEGIGEALPGNQSPPSHHHLGQVPPLLGSGPLLSKLKRQLIVSFPPYDAGGFFGRVPGPDLVRGKRQESLTAYREDSCL